MAESKTKKAIKKIEAELKKIEKKQFKVMFFVIDTKGTPNASLSYTYDIALSLKEMGYNVQMLHSEKDFVGVEQWLGEKYSSLPHYNIEKDNVDISPADFLFIPEIYSNVMSQTKTFPCKRIAILENMDYLTEVIPAGATWDDMGIRDCITTSEALADRIKEVFPKLNTYVVNPFINDVFNIPTEPKKLIVNVVAKDSSTTNSIVKNFFWKYPNYKWVAFRELKNLPREDFAKALKEGIITIWDDYYTNFGYSALEAMACGDIVIGHIPEEEPEWMTDGGKLKNNGVWYYKTRECQQLTADVIQSYLHDSIPQVFYKEMSNTVNAYNKETTDNKINKIFVETLFETRKKELEFALGAMKNKLEKENTDNE